MSENRTRSSDVVRCRECDTTDDVAYDRSGPICGDCEVALAVRRKAEAA